MDFSAKLQAIRDRIQVACERAGRDPRTVELMAVSKNQSPDRVRDIADLGVTLFGENRIQEAKAKIPECPGALRWHFIGHLQTNKCRDAVSLFSMIQSVDSLHLVEEINKWAERQSKTMPLLLEVNVSGESSKFGWQPDDLIDSLTTIDSLPDVEIHGLMTIAPYATSPERARPYFRRMRELREKAEQRLGCPLPHLSMGMSGDFEVAIEEGATLVRLGSSLFGPREKPDESD